MLLLPYLICRPNEQICAARTTDLNASSKNVSLTTIPAILPCSLPRVLPAPSIVMGRTPYGLLLHALRNRTDGKLPLVS